MPCKVRRSPDEPCTAGPQSLDNSWTKGPRASPAHLQEQCEAFEGPLEGDADKLHQPRGPPSAELRRAQKPCGESPRRAAGSSASVLGGGATPGRRTAIRAE